VSQVESLRDRVSSALIELASRLRSVSEASRISGVSSATFTEVSHTLGKVPSFIHIEPRSQCDWWVTESDRAQWTSTRVFLHFDTASVNFTGYVSVLDS